MSTKASPALGTLRDRIELFSNNQSIEVSGGVSDSFASLGLVWAKVHTMASALGSLANGRNAKTSHSIVMRYRTDLKSGDRIAYRGQYLEILSAEDLNGRRAYLSCRCLELENTG